QPPPTSHLRFGLARADITPPVGIYHPMWGAARHHRATGIHRPLTAEAMAFAPLDREGTTLLRIQLDHIGMTASHHRALLAHITAATGVTAENIVTTFSHSHAAGLFAPDRVHLPGGELIEDHLVRIYTNVTAAAVTAIANLQPAFVTYATGCCTLATNRDYWDDESDFFACGFNPDGQADDTLVVARITDAQGEPLGIVVNYGCHPTTLAWENTLISPDYVGAMREVVEEATGATCIFALGACGELSPRQCHVGSTAVADANGRNLGYAALATLATMDPPARDFAYAGPVISGATLGTWQHVSLDDARLQQAAIFAGGEYVVELPQRKLPDPVALEAEMEEWGTKQHEADQAGDVIAARDYGARLERARRWRGRVQHLEDRPTAPFHYTVYRLGDAFWVTTGGEPYSLIQTELRKRFPNNPILFSPLASDFQMAYLLPADRYGKGLYQEEPSILAQGCLEELIEAVAGKIMDLL
ncbi:MAG: neutral/alkaline non-lysosomal ceramidase N-terminal domain-containing protein, partial [Caldilineaceae bacterium]|nr:neutral/alkaline non-lysosomal ceramidase N-terminal domain-containing protein [Caldilineaceae bacterium]